MPESNAELATRIVRALSVHEPGEQWDWVGKLITGNTGQDRPTTGQDLPRSAIVDDALEPDPMSDEIEKLEREAQPIAKICPHCGRDLTSE